MNNFRASLNPIESEEVGYFRPQGVFSVSCVTGVSYGRRRSFNLSSSKFLANEISSCSSSSLMSMPCSGNCVHSDFGMVHKVYLVLVFVMIHILVALNISSFRLNGSSSSSCIAEHRCTNLRKTNHRMKVYRIETRKDGRLLSQTKRTEESAMNNR